jgi:uncharacterized protein
MNYILNATGKPDIRHPAPETSTLVEEKKSKAEQMFASARGSHAWEHTQRVYQLCRHIGGVEGADMEVLLLAACLHDIGRAYQDTSEGRVCHAEKGVELARPIIEPLPITGDRKNNVLHCIQAHRFRKPPIPETAEARVLFDADKLDAIGAVGVARAYLFAGEVGARLHNPDVDVENTRSYTSEDTGFREFKVKLSKIKDGMLTREGGRMATARHAFMTAFFERLQAEHRGDA